ncbi:MAG: DUF1289 domain-containing protein [Hyphomicrobiaceae bacterium]
MDTPCIDICTMDPKSGLCLGCRRTIREIAAWASLSPAERRRIMSELPARPLPQGPGAAPRRT